jgi:flagellar hook-associated protein 3 FlgL
MNITGFNSLFNPIVDQLASQKLQMTDLTQQLTTGYKSSTYGGLGSARSLALAFQSQIDQANGYQNTIALANTRISVINTEVQRLSSIGSDMKGQFDQQSFNLLASGVTDQQQASTNSLEEMISIFNGNVGGQYVFGGKQTDQSSVTPYDTIMNGTGSQAGLKQVISERLQADQGTNGLGRLTVNTTGTATTIAEDAVSPFGLKLKAITSSLTNATVTQPSGSPQSESVDFSGGQPNAGDAVTFDFTMPDGTDKTITLTASSSASNATTGTFQIGATPAATASSLNAALTGALQTTGQTDLVAASAMAAGGNFFNTYQGQAPQRVAGPPFASATALTNGTAADTVQWYTGDQSATNPRLDSSAKIDSAITANYGMRANEPAFSWLMQNLAVASAMNVSAGTTTDKAAYSALTDRVQINLGDTSSNHQISSIQTDIASTSASLQAAQARHTTEIGTYQTLVDNVQNADQTATITELASLQTEMQASYQASSILFKLTLASYL